MRDPDIRKALRETLLARHHEDFGTRIVEEMYLCRGKGRIDMAVVNGELAGIEIKSTRDTLVRLPRQILIYSAIFDRVTLVTSEKHFTDAERLIPKWWGIDLALPGDSVSFEPIRDAAWNEKIDPALLVQLLWRDEALQILSALGEDRLVRTSAKKLIWKRVVAAMGADELRSSVRETMKLRQNWRRDPLFPQSGD